MTFNYEGEKKSLVGDSSMEAWVKKLFGFRLRDDDRAHTYAV